MNPVRIFIVLFIIKVLPGTVLISQPVDIISYENHFFELDFQNHRYDFSDFENFFFTTFPHDDPTAGDVVYDRVKWSNEEMIQLLPEDALYGYVKYRNDKTAFDSFRFTSKPYYNLNEDVKKILFVFKGKLPSAQGIWSAWWLNGSRQEDWLYKNDINEVTDQNLDRYTGIGQFYDTPSQVNSTDWPGAGEIDIIENINGQKLIHNTIHTCPQMCDSEWNDDGVVMNCAGATLTDPNSGCSGTPYEVESLAGTFACLWESNSLHFYYWDPQIDVRSAGGPLSGSPSPELWSDSNLKNYVRFKESSTDCEEEIHQAWQCENCSGKDQCEFVNLKMIFNITLCGKWAGAEFDESENSLQNCREYILTDGKDNIHNQYMKIEYVSVQKLP